MKYRFFFNKDEEVVDNIYLRNYQLMLEHGARESALLVKQL
jgi:hypothetical protein